MPHPLAIAIKLAGSPKKIEILKNNLSLKKKFLFQKSNINLYCKNKVVNIKFSNSYLVPKKRVVIKGSKGTLYMMDTKEPLLLRKKEINISKRFFIVKLIHLKTY